MATVYVETTIPSYLSAWPSADLVMAAHQKITHDWWRVVGEHDELFVSETVLAECRRGDPGAAVRRLAVIESLLVLELNDEIKDLHHEYLNRLGLPTKAQTDALHLAIAVYYEMDCLVTWNCRHIVNDETIRRLMRANLELGWATPAIVTPESLLSRYSSFLQPDSEK